jgi:nitronate monooxygenase
MNFGGSTAKVWKDVWGCGQGIGAITQVQPAASFVAQLKREYAQARAKVLAREYA